MPTPSSPPPATLGSVCGSSDRLKTLYSYGLLDTPAEPEFDNVTRIIAQACRVPIAVINLVDEDRQWFKSEIGLGVRETPMEVSICAQALLEDELLVVPDTRKDPRFAENPLVSGDANLRFYAGAQLRAPDGQVLGTLCVLDHVPRDLDEEHRGLLLMLARHVMSLFEMRRQARYLDEARREAEKAHQAKDRFLSLLSHELRTPLTPIMLSSSALMADPSLKSDQKEAVEMIQRNVKLQVRLIDDLLDFTRLGHHRLQLEREPVNLNDMLREVVSIVESEPTIPLITTTFRARDPLVEGDAIRLQQVFWNLLRNAVKFTPATGSITVETSDLDSSTIRVVISDTGIGIAPDHLPHIFEPFGLDESRPSKRVGGLGLGLAIVKGITELHGASVTASSNGYLTGATFTLDFPRLASTVKEEVVATTKPVPSPVRLRILLVEDQAATAISLTKLLFRAGHEVFTAGTVAAARSIAARQSFDVLISDLGLPDGTGYDLMSFLRQSSPSTRGIALSGHSSDRDRAASAEAGFARHLTKPVDYSDVEAALYQVAAS